MWRGLRSCTRIVGLCCDGLGMLGWLVLSAFLKPGRGWGGVWRGGVGGLTTGVCCGRLSVARREFWLCGCPVAAEFAGDVEAR